MQNILHIFTNILNIILVSIKLFLEFVDFSLSVVPGPIQKCSGNCFKLVFFFNLIHFGYCNLLGIARRDQ